MRCAACGLDNPASFTTCAACAQPLAGVCATCRAPLYPDVRFCGACGAPVAMVASAADAHHTERRLVSVLFADIAGFTGWAEEHDPEEVRDLLTHYFDAVRETIARYGGQVEKFIGDAAMAVWGAPVAHEDDAERAVRAAIEIVSGGDPEVRAGVATGRAAVTRGAIGQGMIAGDVVNTAARLQTSAEPGSVLVDDVTYRATRLAIAFGPPTDLALRNKRGTVSARPAVRVVAGRRGEGRADTLEPPLVGRTATLRALKDRYHIVAREKRAQLVTIVGHAGMGKSRIAWELEKYLDGLATQTLWHRAATPAYGQRLAYAALAEMVRQRAGIRPGDAVADNRARLRRCLGEFSHDDAERRRLEGPLAALVGLPSPPVEDRDELFAAWHTFFERLAAVHPTVLVFDDLQWADDALLDFIERLVAWPRIGPLLVIAVARPELLTRRPNWTRAAGNRTAIDLAPLTAASIQRLILSLAPSLRDRLARRARDRARGVPLYAVEIARMLTDRLGTPPRDPRSRRQAARLDLVLPESLHALMAARLDALDGPTRSVLGDAAVIGTRFSLNALAAVSGRARTSLEPALDRLVQAGLLARDGSSDRRRPTAYRFIDWAAQEVAYSTLSRRYTRPRHMAAARYYEAMEDPGQVGIVASHVLAAYRAGPREPEASQLAAWATRALRSAAARAMQLHAPHRALSHLEDALSVVRSTKERADIWEEAATAAESAARHDVSEGFLRRAIRHHRHRNATEAVSRLSVRLGGVLLMQYRVRDALRLLRGTLASLRVEGPGRREDVSLMARLARAHSLREERAEAIEWSTRALVGARRLRLPGVAAESLMTLGAELFFSGQTRRGLALMRRAVRTAERNGLVVAGARARANLAAVLLYSDPRAALLEARDGLVIARDLGLRDLAVRLTSVGAGDAALDTGDWSWASEAIAELDVEELPPPDLVDLASASALVDAWRGDPAGDERLRAMAEERPAEPLGRAILAYRQAALDLADGDAANALRRSMVAVRTLGTLGYGWAAIGLGWSIAARAATWSGDRRALRAALAAVEAHRLDSRWWLATHTTMLAGLRALEGDDAHAGQLYAAAARRWAGLSLPMRVALTRLDQAATSGPGAERARHLARAILVDLGADRFVTALDRGAWTVTAAPRRRGRSRRPIGRTARQTDGGHRTPRAMAVQQPPG